jgi:hypothetical protein
MDACNLFLAGVVLRTCGWTLNTGNGGMPSNNITPHMDQPATHQCTNEEWMVSGEETKVSVGFQFPN